MSQSAGAWSEPHPVARAGERIRGLARSQIVALTDAPLFTSAFTPWAGFLLEVHGPRGLRQDVWWSWYHTHVCLITSGTLGFQVRQATRIQHFQARTGNILLFPRGFGEARFLVDQYFQLTCVELDGVELDRQRAARFLGGKSVASQGALLPQFNRNDSHVGALLRNMAAEIAGGCRAGKLYGQALSLSLAAYLEGRFSAEPVEQTRGQRPFCGPQMQR